MRARRTGPAGLLVAGALLLTACGSPAPDPYDHRDAVLTAVDGAVAEVGTVAVVLDAWRSGRATQAYTTVVLRESSAALGSAADALAGLTPPRTGDALQDDASTALADADDAVTAARVAVERSDPRGADDAGADLEDVTAVLEGLSEELS